MSSGRHPPGWSPSWLLAPHCCLPEALAFPPVICGEHSHLTSCRDQVRRSSQDKRAARRYLGGVAAKGAAVAGAGWALWRLFRRPPQAAGAWPSVGDAAGDPGALEVTKARLPPAALRVACLPPCVVELPRGRTAAARILHSSRSSVPEWPPEHAASQRTLPRRLAAGRACGIAAWPACFCAFRAHQGRVARASAGLRD